MKEIELYAPLKAWLEAQGYVVRGEVGRCDLAAKKDGELIAVELKLRPSLALLAQAAERQEYADAVYVALPATGERRRPPASRDFRRLLSRLGIGLLLVTFLKTRTTVEVLMHPRSVDAPTPGLPARRRPKKKAAMLREITGRSLDLTPGGLPGGRGRITAYRQRAFRLAAWLTELGEASPAELRRLGAPDDAGGILSRNLYGWFERKRRGVYTLHPAGANALGEVPELATVFREELAGKLDA